MICHYVQMLADGRPCLFWGSVVLAAEEQELCALQELIASATCNICAILRQASAYVWANACQ